MKTGLLVLGLLAVLQLLVLSVSKPYNCEFGHLYSKTSRQQSAVPRAHELLMSGRRMLQTMESMRITLNTDDFDTIKTTTNGEDQTTA